MKHDRENCPDAYYSEVIPTYISSILKVSNFLILFFGRSQPKKAFYNTPMWKNNVMDVYLLA